MTSVVVILKHILQDEDMIQIFPYSSSRMSIIIQTYFERLVGI